MAKKKKQPNTRMLPSPTQRTAKAPLAEQIKAEIDTGIPIDDLAIIFEDELLGTDGPNSLNAVAALVLGFSFIPRREADRILKQATFVTLGRGSRCFAPDEIRKDRYIIVLDPQDLASISDGVITVCHEAAHVACGHNRSHENDDEYRLGEDQAWKKVREWLPPEYKEAIDLAEMKGGGTGGQPHLLARGNWQRTVAAAIEELPTDLRNAVSSQGHGAGGIDIALRNRTVLRIRFFDEDGESGVVIESHYRSTSFEFGREEMEVKGAVQMMLLDFVLDRPGILLKKGRAAQ
jgi:hypothetical protein